MKIERVGDSIREIIDGNDLLRSLMKVSEYIIYGFTALLVLSAIVSLSSFVDALFAWLFVALLILAFAGKKYLGLIVLISGKVFYCLYGLISGMIAMASWRGALSGYIGYGIGFNWSFAFGIVVYGLLLWLSIVLFLKSRPAKASIPAAPSYMPPMQQNGMPAASPITQPMNTPPAAPAVPQAPAGQAPADSVTVPMPGVMPQAPAGNPVQTLGGAPLVDGKCPSCGAPCRADMSFCVNCGQHLAPPAPKQ